MLLASGAVASDDQGLVSRRDRRPQASLYAFSLRAPLPAFVLPLRSGDAEPMVDLQGLLTQVYDRAGFDDRVDDAIELPGELGAGDLGWVAA